MVFCLKTRNFDLILSCVTACIVRCHAGQYSILSSNCILSKFHFAAALDGQRVDVGALHTVNFPSPVNNCIA